MGRRSVRYCPRCDPDPLEGGEGGSTRPDPEGVRCWECSTRCRVWSPPAVTANPDQLELFEPGRR